MEVTKEKGLKKKDTGAVALTQDFTDGGWDNETVDTKDIIIPKVLLMHGSSELVKQGERNVGEIIKSTTGEVIAARGKTFEIVVMDKWKEWRIMRWNTEAGRFEYDRMEAWTPDNDTLPWEYTENGEKFRRDKALNFYGILAKDVENPFPIKLQFVRTAYKAGHKIADAYARALMEKQPPTRQVFEIGSELVKTGEDSYFTFTSKLGRASTEQEKAVALQWRKVIAQAKATNSIQDHEETDTQDVTPVNSEF